MLLGLFSRDTNHKATLEAEVRISILGSSPCVHVTEGVKKHVP